MTTVVGKLFHYFTIGWSIRTRLKNILIGTGTAIGTLVASNDVTVATGGLGLVFVPGIVGKVATVVPVAAGALAPVVVNAISEKMKE